MPEDDTITMDDVVERNCNVAEHYKNGLLTAQDARDSFDRIMSEYCSQWYFTRRKD